MITKPYDKVNENLRTVKMTRELSAGQQSRMSFQSLIDVFRRMIINIVLTGDDIAQGKPNPEGFKLFLQRTKLNPSNVLVIENAPLGVQASNNAT